MKSTNVDVKMILVAKVRILFLEWIARLLRMQRRRETMTRKCNNILVDGRDQELLMITRKCNSILIDGDQEVLMGRKNLVFAKTYILCRKSLVTF